MLPQRKVPVEVVDSLPEMEARIAFLSAACLAISEKPDGDIPDAKAWEGLFYWTADMEAMLRKLNQMTEE